MRTKSEKKYYMIFNGSVPMRDVNGEPVVFETEFEAENFITENAHLYTKARKDSDGNDVTSLTCRQTSSTKLGKTHNRSYISIEDENGIRFLTDNSGNVIKFDDKNKAKEFLTTLKSNGSINQNSVYDVLVVWFTASKRQIVKEVMKID